MANSQNTGTIIQPGPYAPPLFTKVDKTDYTWNQILSNPPEGSEIPLEANKYCLSNENTCKTESARVTIAPTVGPATGWNPVPLPSFLQLNGPAEYCFLDDATFIRDPNSGKLVFDIKKVSKPSAACDVKVYALDYPNLPSAAPAFIGVLIPQWLDKTKPISFLLYFEHQPGQIDNPAENIFFKYLNPLGYDWMLYQLYKYINYYYSYNAHRYYPNKESWYDVPLYSEAISSFGLAYQLQRSQKQYVIVLPHINREPDAKAQGKLQDYQFYSAGMVQAVLQDLRQDILGKPDYSDLNVSLASFSSGCSLSMAFIQENLRSNDQNVQRFMKNELNELFWFAPSSEFKDGPLKVIGQWLNHPLITQSEKSKCLRYYTQDYYDSLNTIKGIKDKFVSGKAAFFESDDKKVSVGYFPNQPSANQDNIWRRTYEVIYPQKLASAERITKEWVYVHHQIPALMLTDALNRSLIV